jgi:putative ABC transport system permease protein
MTLKYVLKNLSRRKVRSLLMLLALIVGVAALVALNTTVGAYERFYVATISNSAGDYDLVITKNELESEPLILDAPALIDRISAAGIPQIKTVTPRIQGVVTVDVMGGEELVSTTAPASRHGSAQLIALDQAADTMGDLQVVSGTLNLSPGYAVVLQATADTFGLSPGDTLDISYALPIPRQKGVAGAADVSRRHARTTLVVSAIALQRGLSGRSDNDGVVLDLEYARQWLNLPGQAERVVVAFDERIYNEDDPQAAAFRARFLAEEIQALLGEAYDYKLPRAKILSETYEAFIFFQAFVSIYGILSLSVVGALVRTMMSTNVREQTRDLALFRILGAPRHYLFILVAAEVAVLGAVGIGLGATAGQILTNTLIVPLIAEWANVPLSDVPAVEPRALFVAIATAVVVLGVSAYSPARRAAGTKIMYAINPGVAEGLGLDDLAKLRERRVNFRIFWSGLVTLFYPALIFFVFPLAFTFGVLWLQASLIFGSLLLLIMGTSLLFFPVILPMEWLLVGLIGLVAGKVGYFARRNVARGQNRNTTISLMIVLSATLPTFFATTLAIETVNTPTDLHLSNGTPLIMRKAAQIQATEEKNRFTRDLLADIRANGLLGPSVAVTYLFNAQIRDDVDLRNVGVQVYGVDGNLAKITYPEGITWIAGSFEALQADPNGVIVSQGLAEFFERGLGDTLRLKGAGLDHIRIVRIVGVLGRFSGFEGFTSKRTWAEEGRTTLFLNESAFRELTRNPLDGPYDPTAAIFERLLAAPNLRPGIASLSEEAQNTATQEAATLLRREFGLTEGVTVVSTPEEIETATVAARQIQVVIFLLTSISFVLAIFGVFVVMYISVYTRRSEIAMLKAIGDSNYHLFGMFLAEALVMTLSATLTGVIAGIILGYVFRYSSAFRSETPTVPAFDTWVTSSMLLLMVLAALVSTLFASWSYLRRKAVEIIRAI